eukprot:904438-Pyramimonas_sp.AAC.1
MPPNDPGLLKKAPPPLHAPLVRRRKSFWLRYVHVLNDDESRTPPYRNLSWSKIGSIDKAWEQAKQAVHWDEAVAAQAAAEAAA